MVAGGQAVQGEGYFIQPTVLVNTRPDMMSVTSCYFQANLALSMTTWQLPPVPDAADPMEGPVDPCPIVPSKLPNLRSG